jgi:predicted transcriptional regulator
MPIDSEIGEPSTLTLSAAIVSAYVAKNTVPSAELPALLRTVYATMRDVSGDAGSGNITNARPAVPVRRSVMPDYIVCLEDGKKLTMLKRYIRSRYKLSPDEYRTKWGLPADYPMVAPNYSELRSQFAKKIGLGRLPKAVRANTPAKKKRYP